MEEKFENGFRKLAKSEQDLLQYLMTNLESDTEHYARYINDSKGKVPHVKYVAYALSDLLAFIEKKLVMEPIDPALATNLQLIHWAFLKKFSASVAFINDMTAQVDKTEFARFVVKAIAMELGTRLEGLDRALEDFCDDNPYHHDTPGLQVCIVDPRSENERVD